MVGEITFTILNVAIFITHVLNLRNGCYANVSNCTPNLVTDFGVTFQLSCSNTCSKWLYVYDMSTKKLMSSSR